MPGAPLPSLFSSSSSSPNCSTLSSSFRRRAFSLAACSVCCCSAFSAISLSFSQPRSLSFKRRFFFSSFAIFWASASSPGCASALVPPLSSARDCRCLWLNWSISSRERKSACAAWRSPSTLRRYSSRSRSKAPFAGAASTSFRLSKLRTIWFLTSFALQAKCSVDSVSENESCDGEMHAIKLVLLFPPRLSFSSRVSFESRYDTCLRRGTSVRLPITFDSADRDWLMCLHSSRRGPFAFDTRSRSDPARSTRSSTPLFFSVRTGVSHYRSFPFGFCTRSAARRRSGKWRASETTRRSGPCWRSPCAQSPSRSSGRGLLCSARALA